MQNFQKEVIDGIDIARSIMPDSGNDPTDPVAHISWATSIMKYLCLSLIALVMIIGCSKSIDMETARKVADSRFLDYAKTLRLDTSTIAEPAVQNRADDYVFTYTD